MSGLSDVSILFPFKPDGGYRDIAFDWLMKRYRHILPEAELVVGLLSDDPFSKARAVNKAASLAGRPVFAIADADSLFTRAQVEIGLELLAKYAWVVPWSHKVKLNARQTQRIIKSNPTTPEVQVTRRHLRVSPSYEGFLMLPADCFHKVGGYDERFAGWGGQNKAFIMSVNTLCGRRHRVDGFLYHLWHPTSFKKNTPRELRRYNNILRNRYRDASGDVKAMTELVQERWKEQ